jgi:23S rRNA (uracil1939-C5)-methyltransferase
VPCLSWARYLARLFLCSHRVQINIMPTEALQPGQRVELAITDVAFGGDGIGRHEGFVVFVPFVIAGERIEAEIVEVKRRYATADLVRVIEPGPARVTARCPYYQQCAGCQYQHISYGEQLALKQKQIRDVFQRLGGIPNPPVEAVVPSPHEYGYRNKLVVHGPGRPGFWTMRGRSIITVEQCPIAQPSISAALQEISQQSLENVHLTVRLDGAGVIHRFTELPRPAADEGWEGDNGTVGGEPGPSGPMVSERVLGKALQVPLGSFFQINHEVIERVIEHVRGLVATANSRFVVDAYCGIGLFALLLADQVEHVYGMEIDPQAIAAANANARELGIKQADFYAGPTERLLYYTLRQCRLGETTLILDPPRSGCTPAVLKTLRTTRPAQIVYVSCAPDMLARDVKTLRAAGYHLDRITPFDMFPQTKHCEAVAVLKADKPAAVVVAET